MIPTWMGIERVVTEMDSVRRVVGNLESTHDVDQALREADMNVRSLSLESDDAAVHRAWRAVSKAEEAVKSATRLSSSRRRAR